MRVLFESMESHPLMKSLVRSGTVLSKVWGPVILNLAGSIGPFTTGILHVEPHVNGQVCFECSFIKACRPKG